MICILGIDPGQHGGFSIVKLNGDHRAAYAYNKQTLPEIVDTLRAIKETNDLLGFKTLAFIEEVHSMPKDGKASAFSFGQNYGAWLATLISLKIGYKEIPPGQWQAGLKLRVRGMEYRDKKKALKEKAQKLFPDLNLTLDTCDAALIAEYGRQVTLAERKAAGK